MFTAASPPVAMALLLLASLLMILSGRTRNRLVMKSPICPVCRRERKRCTCRWL